MHIAALLEYLYGLFNKANKMSYGPLVLVQCLGLKGAVSLFTELVLGPKQTFFLWLYFAWC